MSRTPCRSTRPSRQYSVSAYEDPSSSTGQFQASLGQIGEYLHAFLYTRIWSLVSFGIAITYAFNILFHSKSSWSYGIFDCKRSEILRCLCYRRLDVLSSSDICISLHCRLLDALSEKEVSRSCTSSIRRCCLYLIAASKTKYLPVCP